MRTIITPNPKYCQTVEFHDCFEDFHYSQEELLVTEQDSKPAVTTERDPLEAALNLEQYSDTPPLDTNIPCHSRARTDSVFSIEDVVSKMSDRVTFLQGHGDESEDELEVLPHKLDQDKGQYFSDNQIKVFESIFQTLDINGDGQVSPSELRKALKFMNIKVDKTVCSRMVYEFNPDGFLNIDIFMDLVAELFQRGWLDPKEYNIELQADQKKRVINSADDLLKIFHSFDQDKSGNISRSEIRTLADDLNLHMTELEIDKFMERADRDKDGSIDQEEFLEYFGKLLF